MPKLNVRAHKLYDQKFDNWATDVHDKWVYDDFKADPAYSKGWISMTSLGYHAASDAVYVGIGSFERELLWRFDRKAGAFISCGYEKIAGAFDAKFHRSLEIDGDLLYGATALFHDLDKQFVAEGGRLVRYDIRTGDWRVLGIPVPRIYVQSIALDRKAQTVYGFGGFPEVFWRYDIATGQARFIAYLGSGFESGAAHCPVIDDEGCVWGTYGILRAFAYNTGPDSLRLFRYDPRTDTMEFLKHGLLSEKPGDKAKPDTALNIGDGYLYFGTESGLLERVDPKTGGVKLLCKPSTKGSRRLAALRQHPRDGLLYGITGDDFQIELFCYDPRAEKLVFVQDFADAQGNSPEKVHDCVFAADGTLYAGENDNNHRSSYLWECGIETE